MRLNTRHRWAAWKFGQVAISNVAQILDANLAGKESVRGQVAQEREERHSLTYARILRDAFAICDEIEHFGPLLWRAIEISVPVAIVTCGVEPHQTAAKGELIVRVLACEQINKLRGARFVGASAVRVSRKDRLPQGLQRLVLLRRKVFRRVRPRLARSLFRVDHVVGIL